jgi:hypothetical protein
MIDVTHCEYPIAGLAAGITLFTISISHRL